MGGTGQSVLTIGALMLISVLVMNFYRTSNDISTSLDFSRFHLEGLSVLTSHIEQLSQYFFDEVSTDITSEKALGDFALPAHFGWDADDSTVVDDIDDLHGTTVVDTGISGVIYHVDYNVEYVRLSSGAIVHSDLRQWHKRVTISVSDAFNPPMIYSMNGNARMRDTLRISTVVSYWFYN